MTSKGLRILVLEDHPDARSSLVRLLAVKGHSVTAVGTVAEAIAALEGRPEVLLLDLMLPDGNGLMVLNRLRTMGYAARVAFVSAVLEPPTLSISDYEPCPVFFQKPVKPERLMAWLDGAATNRPADPTPREST